MILSARARENFVISLITVLGVIALDRVSKLFFTHLLSLGESLPLIPNIVHFTLVHNTGIAFGLFKNQGVLFIVIPIIVIVLIAYNLYLCRDDLEISRLNILAFAMILAGAMGNLADRVVYGHVIDFIDFRFWPVFNIADSAITIGTAILLIKCIPFFAK